MLSPLPLHVSSHFAHKNAHTNPYELSVQGRSGVEVSQDSGEVGADGSEPQVRAGDLSFPMEKGSRVPICQHTQPHFNLAHDVE